MPHNNREKICRNMYFRCLCFFDFDASVFRMPQLEVLNCMVPKLRSYWNIGHANRVTQVLRHLKSTQNTFLIYCHGCRICQASCTFVATKVTCRLPRIGAISLLFALRNKVSGNIASGIRDMKNTKTAHTTIKDTPKQRTQLRGIDFT